MSEQGHELAIRPVYRDRLARALESPKHAMPLTPEFGLRLVETSHEGVTLAALVDPTVHMVRKAAYSNPASDVHRGLLEVLCETMIDRPVQECADHAAIYLEHRLRDPAQPRPVPGVVTPDNADSAFRLPSTLVRALARAYWQTAPPSGTENFFDPPSSPEWRDLSGQGRHRRVQAALANACAALEISDVEISLLSAGHDGRVFLEFRKPAPSDVKGRLLIAIETHLKTTVEQTLHVYTAERKDMNKIRRLAMTDAGASTAVSSRGEASQ